MSIITTAQAVRALQAGIAKADAMREPSCLAIVDGGGNLIAFLRSDNAQHGTIGIAQNKAYTASAFRIRTGDLARDVQPGGELYGIEVSGGARPFVVFGGGVPVMRDEVCVGAVGVSGGPVATDEAIADVMVAALVP